MTEPINIPINITRGSMEGLEALTRHLNELLGPGTRAGFRRQLNIAANIEPGSMAGFEAAARRAGEVTQQVMLRVARQASQGLYTAQQAVMAEAGDPASPFWQRVRMGGVARPVAVSPMQGPLGFAWYPGNAGAPLPAGPGPAAAFWRAGGRGPGAPFPEYLPAAERGHPTGGRLYGPDYIAAAAGRPTYGRIYGPEYVSAAALGRATGGRIYGPEYEAPFAWRPAPAGGLDYRFPEYESAAAQGRRTYGRVFGPEYESAAAAGRPTYGRIYGPDLPPGGGGGGGGGAGGGGGGRWGMGGLGMLGRGLARLPGIAIGYGAYQAISAAMGTAEERFRGVLEIGTILQGQYQNIDRTILGLRDSYQILARDARTALTTVARATGDVTGLGVGEAMRVGRAYGFEREAPAMLATLATLGAGGAPNLAAMTAVYNQSVAGRARISLPRFMEAATEIAGVGGFGARPLTGEQLAQTTAMMTLMGGRYAANPAQAYADYFGGLQAPTSPLGESLRMTAVGAAARQQRFRDIGDIRNVDMSTWTGQRMAMEQAGQLPWMREAYYRQIQAQAQGSEGLAVALTQEMFGISNTAQALDLWRSMQREAVQPGGFAGLRPNQAQEQRHIDQALADQRSSEASAQGQRLRERDAQMERLDEAGIIKGLQDVSIEIGKTVGAVAEAWNSTRDPIKTAAAAIGELGQKTYATISVMTTLAGVLTANPALIGLGLTGAGGVALSDVLQPFALPGSPTAGGIGAPSPGRQNPVKSGP